MTSISGDYYYGSYGHHINHHQLFGNEKKNLEMI